MNNYRVRYWNETTFGAVEELSGIATDAGVTLVELAEMRHIDRIPREPKSSAVRIAHTDLRGSVVGTAPELASLSVRGLVEEGRQGLVPGDLATRSRVDVDDPLDARRHLDPAPRKPTDVGMVCPQEGERSRRPGLHAVVQPQLRLPDQTERPLEPVRQRSLRHRQADMAIVLADDLPGNRPDLTVVKQLNVAGRRRYDTASIVGVISSQPEMPASWNDAL